MFFLISHRCPSDYMNTKVRAGSDPGLSIQTLKHMQGCPLVAMGVYSYFTIAYRPTDVNSILDPCLAIPNYHSMLNYDPLVLELSMHNIYID